MIIPKNVFDLLKPMPPFIYEMRLANRANLKSQTRRVADKGYWHIFEESFRVNGKVKMNMLDFEINSPYGRDSDIRYMREPLYKGFGDYVYYQDDKVVAINLRTGNPMKWRWKTDVLSGMFMPKVAARTFKRYEFIRVERLQEISDEDCIAEGISSGDNWNEVKGLKLGKDIFLTAKHAYETLWNEINAKRGYPWSRNCWVWVIGYKPFDMSEIAVPSRSPTLPSPEGRGGKAGM